MEARPAAGAAAHEETDQLTRELERAARLIAFALVAIAITAGLIVLIGRTRDTHGLGAIAIVVETAMVFFGMTRLARQIFRHTRLLEEQRTRFETQAAQLQAAAAQAEDAQHRAEAETQQKARVVALLDAALASAPVGFAFFDRELRYLRVNETLARMTGRPVEDHVGEPLRRFDPDLQSEVSRRLERVLATREPESNVELRGVTPGTNGETRRWLTSFYPIAAPGDELFGAGVVVTDVTELRGLEEQLFQAQKMEAVGRLAGGVAHDFNNLLTVINGYAQLMLTDPEMARGRDEVTEIRAAASRAADLTRQLLAFSRRQAVEERVVNPNDVLRGVESLLRQLVVGNVDITAELSADTPLIRVDPGQLEQVVMNLAINAADAMPEGGRLHIETAPASLGIEMLRRNPDLVAGDYAMIRITDSGHGMDAATAAQIFEPFFTTKEPGKGTGLGLSTAYGIVKQFGGHIDVASQPGAGAVFTVYLPTAGVGEAAEA